MASIFSSFRQRLIAFILLGFSALLGIVGMSIWLGYTSQINFENALLARDIRAVWSVGSSFEAGWAKLRS